MEQHPSARADFFWSIGWIVAGAAIVYGSWTMDRLEAMHINPYTAPGLVPGVLGLGVIILGALLMVRAVRASGLRGPEAAGETTIAPGRLAAALILCFGYAVGLIGRGLPFWLSTFFFVTASILVFQWSERRVQGTLAKGALLAAACGAGTAFAVTMIFQEIFLVRLP